MSQKMPISFFDEVDMIADNDNIPYRIAKTDMSRTRESFSLLVMTRRI